MNADTGDESRTPKLTPPFVRRSADTPSGSVSGERIVQPPFARPRGTTGEHAAAPAATPSRAAPAVSAENLRSISEYLYAPAAEAAPAEVVPAPESPVARETPRPPTRTPEKIGNSGSWVLEEWQRLDAQKAGTLTADPDSDLAQEAWSDLDWDEDTGRSRRKRPAEMVAVILERIARRIRAGEIRVAGTPGMSEEAALAAALSALLGVRRP